MTKPLDLALMTDKEFNDFVIEQMMGGWIPLKMYQKAYPTETSSSIETRLQRGHWVRGVHYRAPKGGGPWVCLPAIRKWLEDGAGPDGEA